MLYSVTNAVFLMKEVERHKYCYTRKCKSFIIVTHQLSNRIQIGTRRTQVLLKYEKTEFDVSPDFSWNVCPWGSWISILHSVLFPLDYPTAIKVMNCDTGCSENTGMPITLVLFYCVVFLFHFVYKQKPNLYHFPSHQFYKVQVHWYIWLLCF